MGRSSILAHRVVYRPMPVRFAVCAAGAVLCMSSALCQPAKSDGAEFSQIGTNRASRTFRIDPNFFRVDSGATGDEPDSLTLQTRATKFLGARGLDFFKPNPPRIFLNERLGTLMAEGNLEDLEAVANALKDTGTTLPQVMIEVRTAEISASVLHPDVQWLFEKMEDDRLDALLHHVSSQMSPPEISTLHAVLTATETIRILKSMEQLSGIDLVSAPRVLAASGRQARVMIEEVEEDVTDPPMHAPRRNRPAFIRGSTE